MVVNNSLYTYGYREKKRKKILKGIVHGKKIKDLYVIVFPLFGDGLLEIYPYNQLLSDFYQKLDEDIKIVGIANKKSGAVSLCVDMIQDIYDSGCDFDVHKFFEM